MHLIKNRIIVKILTLEKFQVIKPKFQNWNVHQGENIDNDDFLDMIPKIQSMKERNKLDFIKMKKHPALQKTLSRKWEMTPFLLF